MKRNLLIALFLLGAICLYAPAALTAQDAITVMTAAKNRVTSDTVSSRSRMVITARDGRQTEMLIDQYSKDGPNGARTVIVFQRPANTAGTRFLTMDNASGGSDQWIFLPSLNRVRRIAATESGGSFMGTDFSFDDISSMDRDISLDNHTLLREETINGRPCHVIQSVPKTNYQYSKTITWVDKENYLIYKAEMYNQRNEVVKVMEMSDYKDVQGRLSPMQTKISTVAAGTSTTIFMEIMKYDDPIPDSVFTTAYLETGRAR
ncbi:MAG: outer membrane lipoprotein-sorting protein [Treponema sp.]|nr:outer membrane lipoprotein-sorting protein [Treponema sp.]MCL2251113.1 outer membrane lipoprotein-sorting protein [Treponema sp.]